MWSQSDLWLTHFCWTRLICETKAKLAATPGGRHHLPHHPGRQWHSPVVAWQPSAWTQSHLFRQLGPNEPICTCEQMPAGTELSGESLQRSASTVRVRQNTTLAVCCYMDNLVGWRGRGKWATLPNVRLKRRGWGWGKGWKAGQHFNKLSNQNKHVVSNYQPHDLCWVLSEIVAHLSAQSDIE